MNFDAYPLNGLWIENSSNQLARVVFGGADGQTERIEISNDLNNWEPYTTNVVGANNLFEFYRNTAGSTTDQTYFRGVRLD